MSGSYRGFDVCKLKDKCANAHCCFCWRYEKRKEHLYKNKTIVAKASNCIDFEPRPKKIKKG